MASSSHPSRPHQRIETVSGSQGGAVVSFKAALHNSSSVCVLGRVSEVGLWWAHGGRRSLTYGLQGEVWLFNVITLNHLHYFLGHFLLRRQKTQAVHHWQTTGGLWTPLPPSEVVDGPK